LSYPVQLGLPSDVILSVSPTKTDWKPEAKIYFGISRRRWENNIKKGS
jgi:hypothetical protein